MHEIQDVIALVPLSGYGQDYTPADGKVDPSVDMKTPVRDQVNALDAVAYSTLFWALLKTNPPAFADAPMLKNWRASASSLDKISTRASSMLFSRSGSPRLLLRGSCFISRTVTVTSRNSMVGPARPRRGSMAQTLFNGRL